MTDKTDLSAGFLEGIVDALASHCWDQQQASSTQEEGKSILPPLCTRLQKLLDQIPQNAKQEGLSLLDLQARLRGRKGGMPHVGELGAAMRRLGWYRRRRWSDQDAAFSSKWYPQDRSRSMSDGNP